MAVLVREGVGVTGGRSGGDGREQGWTMCAGVLCEPQPGACTAACCDFHESGSWTPSLVMSLIVKLPSPSQTACCFQGWGEPQGKGLQLQVAEVQEKEGRGEAGLGWWEGAAWQQLSFAQSCKISLGCSFLAGKLLLSACQKRFLPDSQHRAAPASQAAICGFTRTTCVHKGHLCADCPTHTFICRLCRASGDAAPGFLHLLILPSTSQHQQGRSFPSFAKLCMASVSTYLHT